MKKILLTSTGFENKNIENKFLELLNKKADEAKVLFIITAAIDPDAIRMLSGCLDDLTNCGIKDENITIYDLHKVISDGELNKFDAIYVCGGSTKHLVSRMNEINFKETINKYLNNGGIYVGVSAGSVCASGKYENGLGFMNNILDVHCDVGTNNGKIESDDKICLTNNQAIFINDNGMEIFE
ncbi:MAG: Type 1 glutamine amidotransferase-like domain-containing protein [Clostridia bacterium]|nr:Type 1 glutamine amidotransferase-like domain-containing protein [Clostridia bacterium]